MKKARKGMVLTAILDDDFEKKWAVGDEFRVIGSFKAGEERGVDLLREGQPAENFVGLARPALEKYFGVTT